MPREPPGPTADSSARAPRFVRDMALLAASLEAPARSPEAAEALQELLGDLV